MRSLVDRRVLPDVVEPVRVDRQGQIGGDFLILVTPEYPTVGSMLRRDGMDGLVARLGLSLQLARFTRGLVQCQVLCTDMTPDQTVQGPGGRLFVCDYGSYIPVHLAFRDSVVKRPEYRGPEDVLEALPFLPDPYQVFAMGLVIYQILRGDVRALPLALNTLTVEDQDAYEIRLSMDIDILRECDAPESVRVLVRDMLRWHPELRPTSHQVVQQLEEECGPCLTQFGTLRSWSRWM